MNISFFYKYIVASCITFAICSMQSCSDDEAYDVVGDKTNKVFINTDHLNPIGTPKNSYTFEVQHTPEGSTAGSSIEAKFPVRTTRAVEGNIVVTAEIDNSAIDIYNNANGTSYNMIPENLVVLEDMSATVSQGNTLSTDSIEVSIDQTKLDQLTKEYYLVPIKLKSVSDKSAEISSNYNTVYIIINTKEVVIKPNVSPSEMLGTLVSDYSAWTVIADVTASSGSASDVFDGSTNTYWDLQASPVTITLDMKQKKKIGGLRLYSMYAQYGSYYYANKVDVAVSENSIDYKELGAGLVSNMASASNYQYLGFYKPIEAQYIKLKLTWAASWAAGIRELGIYTVN